GGGDALVVPVDGFELLHQRGDGAVVIECLWLEPGDGLVEAFARHGDLGLRMERRADRSGSRPTYPVPRALMSWRRCNGSHAVKAGSAAKGGGSASGVGCEKNVAGC